MGRKLTKEEMVEKIESEGCLLVTERNHILTTDHIEIKCPCGNIYETTYTIFASLNKTKCRECTKKRMADRYRTGFSEMKSRVIKSGYMFVSIDGEYKNNSCKNITVKDKDGFLYLCSLAEIDRAIRGNGGLRTFHKSNTYTIPNIKLWIKLNNKSFELLSDNYSGAKKRNLEFKCLTVGCGEVWTTKLRDILGGCGCLYCHGKRAGKTNSFGDLYSEYLVNWNYDKNLFSPYDVTPAAHRETWWKCCMCGNEWSTDRPNKVIVSGSKCSVCNPHSLGEDSIIKVLNGKRILFDREVTFAGCVYERLLEFDFYIAKYNLIVEYHGQQHYKPVDFAGKGIEWAKSEFKKNKKRDKIKLKYCQDNNIPLLVIPYWDFDNIENILTEKLKV